jgi:large subunit ribosomal protein L19
MNQKNENFENIKADLLKEICQKLGRKEILENIEHVCKKLGEKESFEVLKKKCDIPNLLLLLEKISVKGSEKELFELVYSLFFKIRNLENILSQFIDNKNPLNFQMLSKTVNEKDKMISIKNFFDNLPSDKKESLLYTVCQTLGEKKDIKTGDDVSVQYRLQDRTYKARGTCISVNHNGISSSFTILNIKENIQNRVELTFPLYSPCLSISVDKSNEPKIRRSKLYYLRTVFGKNARLKLKNTVKDKSLEKKI